MNQIAQTKAHRAKMFAVIETFEAEQSEAEKLFIEKQSEAKKAFEASQAAALDDLKKSIGKAVADLKSLIVEAYGEPSDEDKGVESKKLASQKTEELGGPVAPTNAAAITIEEG